MPWWLCLDFVSLKLILQTVLPNHVIWYQMLIFHQCTPHLILFMYSLFHKYTTSRIRIPFYPPFHSTKSLVLQRHSPSHEWARRLIAILQICCWLPQGSCRWWGLAKLSPGLSTSIFLLINHFERPIHDWQGKHDLSIGKTSDSQVQRSCLELDLSTERNAEYNAIPSR